ncbi:hypothetical protein PNA2_1963 [Pyrococcus sp. NA2]|uniref:sodium-dependent transporter n=1 Tax=Pyrococcus sp. (strain NA2) TaxID=342949 RepID=UPI000209AE31|nr:sodium-dependent transporter [Pyrococcus sp. NA2]AEC52877.1 hypothetical protein PNA2_1963 [Pyrococcus sp. NA2]
MARRTLYFVSIFIAYVIGIWTFTLASRVLITGGLKNLILLTIFLGMIGGIAILEANEIKRRPYRIHEFMTKYAKTPSVSIILLTFLLILTGVISHYTGMSLEKIMNVSIPVVGVLILLLGLILLISTKTRSLDIIMASSVLTVILIVIGLIFLRSQANELVKNEVSRSFISNVLAATKSLEFKVTLLDIEHVFIVSVLLFGLGVGFYYIIGGPLASLEVDVKKVIGITMLLQIAMSFIAIGTFAYSLGIAHQLFRDASMRGKAQEALSVYMEYFNPIWEEYRQPERFNPRITIESLYNIPDMLRHLKVKGSLGVILSLMGSIFLAGFTTVLVLLEVGSQLVMDVFQVNRRTSLVTVALLASILAGFASLGQIRTILIGTIISMAPIIGLVEFLPVIKLRRTVTTYALGAILLILGISNIVLITQLKNQYYNLGIIVGIMLLIPLAFNKLLLRTIIASR